MSASKAENASDGPCSAAKAEVSSGPIVGHERIAEGTYRLRVDAPELARAARPGQFAMVRIAGRLDPLLARPLAVYDTAVDVQGGPPATAGGEARYADFVYAVHGKFTQALSRLVVGETIEFWGPLGNGFPPRPTDHLLLVAGGIGQTALLALGKERLGVARYGGLEHAPIRAGRVSLLWGCRTGSLFGDVDDFREAGIETHLATLDGSVGCRGTVVDLLDVMHGDAMHGDGTGAGASPRIACCGPERMMAAVARWSATRGIPCEVSLETPMACGIGICFSCVAPVRDKSGGWDYRRTCLEGPVFDGSLIAW